MNKSGISDLRKVQLDPFGELNSLKQSLTVGGFPKVFPHISSKKKMAETNWLQFPPQLLQPTPNQILITSLA